MTSIANTAIFYNGIMVDISCLIHGIMVHSRSLCNPVMGVLRLASSATIARPTVGARVSTTTGTAVAATGLGLGRARVPA